MALRVNPNRMELIRLRRRLVVAVRGHRLLQDKLEGLIREFTDLVKQYKEQRLELELAKAEQRWSPGEAQSPGFETLRLAAQKLADQLSEVEELEGRLERMLEHGQ